MAVRRASSAPTADDYIDSASDDNDREYFEKEDEDEAAPTSSFVQVGWGAAKKAFATGGGKGVFFKFTEPSHLVKFLSADPMVFAQHWVNGAPDRKSFACIGEECPLCARGNAPSTKYAFRIVDLTSEPYEAQVYIGTRTAAEAIDKQHEGRQGPIDSGYWELSKSGEGLQSRLVVRAVKERDLPEDWDLDPDRVARSLSRVDDPGVKVLKAPTMEDLRKAAEYC